MRKKLLIIDGSSMLTTAYYALLPNEIRFCKVPEERARYFDKILHAKNGTYTNAVYGMTRQLLMLMDGWKPDYLAVMFDKTRSTFRRRLYADYKAQRKETDLPLKEQFLTMEKILADSGIPVFFSDNYEADDLAGTMAEKYAKDKQVVLVSKDKDYLQLVDDSRNIQVWMPEDAKNAENPGKADAFRNGRPEENEMFPTYTRHYQIYTEDDVCRRMHVTPKLVPDLKAIEGDSSDNIPGVKGVSSAAAPLVMEYGGVTGLYKAIEACQGDTKWEKELVSFWKDELGITRSPLNALKAQYDRAMLFRELATIRTRCPEILRYDLLKHPVFDIRKDVFNDHMRELNIRITM